jgi:hypothetical protein
MLLLWPGCFVSVITCNGDLESGSDADDWKERTSQNERLLAQKSVQSIGRGARKTHRNLKRVRCEVGRLCCTKAARRHVGARPLLRSEYAEAKRIGGRKNVLGSGLPAGEEDPSRARHDVRAVGARAAIARRGACSRSRHGCLPGGTRDSLASRSRRGRKIADTGTLRTIAAPAARKRRYGC